MDPEKNNELVSEIVETMNNGNSMRIVALGKNNFDSG